MSLRPQIPNGALPACPAAIARLADALARYRNIAVLTGAGISTESGLSDYRSPGKKRPPIPPINHTQYVRHSAVRKRYWARSFVGFPLLCTAQPGLAHHALAALHDRGGATFRAHITQNVDGLLPLAGVPSARLVELHGSIRSLACHDCGAVETRAAFQTRMVAANTEWTRLLGDYEFRPDGDVELDPALIASFSLPSCRSCGSDAIMPTLVFHGGTVPQEDADAATRAVDACDALLIVGSSVTPYSAFRLVRAAKRDGKYVACINYGETRADKLLDMKVDGLAGDAVAQLANRVLVGGFRPSPHIQSTIHRFMNTETVPGTGMVNL